MPPMTPKAKAAPPSVAPPRSGTVFDKMMEKSKASSGRVGSASWSIDPATSTRLLGPKLQNKYERLLILADTNAGKSYAWLRIAMKEYFAAKAEDRPSKKFFAIDTDNALPPFLEPGGEFDYLYFENGGNVYPYWTPDMADARAAMAHIAREVREGDWVIMDLINRLYSWAQLEVAALTGKSWSDEVVRRIIDKFGFGAFNADEWQQVRQSFEAVTDYPIFRMKCGVNVIGVQHITQIINVEGRTRKDLLDVFDSIGYKPDGAPRFNKTVDTIVMLWQEASIVYERKARQSGKTSRWMRIIKDRGQTATLKVLYDRDMYDVLNECRANKALAARNAVNATTAEEAEQIKDAIDASLPTPPPPEQPTDLATGITDREIDPKTGEILSESSSDEESGTTDVGGDDQDGGSEDPETDGGADAQD